MSAAPAPSSASRRLIVASLKFRLLIVVVAAGMIAAGAVSIRKTPIDVYPEFTPPIVEIQTEALGLSAAEVEQLITVPLEADVLSGVAWLDKIHSESIPGLSSITLIFEPGTNLLRARQMVQERISQPAAIPNVSKPPVMLPPTSSTSRTMIVGLTSEKLSLIQMSVLARWTIRPRLMGVPGVANVSIWGQRERQLQVQVDPARLKKLGVSLDQVMSTTGNSLWFSSLSYLEASTPGTGGFFDAPNQRLAVRHVSPIAKAADLAKVPVEPAGERPSPTRPNGAPLRLGDVAKVVEDHQPLIGDAIIDGKRGLMLVVEKLPAANTVDVTEGVDRALDALKPGLAGITIDSSIFRPATFIDDATRDLAKTLVIGFGLLILVLALLFYQWRTALVAVVAIVSSLTATLYVLYVQGATMNALVFAGLAMGVGVVVDDAIVGAQAVSRRLWENREAGNNASVVASILEATLDARAGLAFATVIAVLPLASVLFLTGLGSAFGRPLALSYLLAVAVSLVVAMTITPALAVMVFARTPHVRRESPVVERLRRGHGWLLTRFTRSPRPAYVAFVILALLGIVAGLQVRRSPVPTFKEKDFMIDLDGPPGTSLPEMDRITARIAAELRSLPGVRDVVGQVGRAVGSDKVVSPNSGTLWVSVDEKADYDSTVISIKRVVRGYPGIDTDLRTYSEARLSEAGTGADEPLVVRVFGQDLEVLRRQTDTVKQALSGVKGLVGVHAELPVEEPTVQVEVDLEAAKASGVKPGDVRRAAATLLSGVQVGSLFEEQKVFDVVVWGTPATRNSLSAMRDLLIDTPGGGHVRLGDVARVSVTSSPNVIERDDVSRRIDVTAGVRGRDRNAVLTDVRRRLQHVEFPLEYHYELVGNFAERQALQLRLMVIGILIALGVLLLLQTSFGNWRLAVLAFLTLPIALVGCAVAMRVDGGTLELGSIVGLLAVFSIAVRHSIVLIRRCQRLEREGGETSGADLVLRAAGERLTPILLAVAGTGAMVLPVVFLRQLPGHEIVSPMGVVVLGGLLTSVLLTLFLLPALYVRFAHGRGLSEELDLRDLWVMRLDEPELAVAESAPMEP